MKRFLLMSSLCMAIVAAPEVCDAKIAIRRARRAAVTTTVQRTKATTKTVRQPGCRMVDGKLVCPLR